MRRAAFKYTIVRDFLVEEFGRNFSQKLKGLAHGSCQGWTKIRGVLHPRSKPIRNHPSLGHAPVNKGQETKDHGLWIVGIHSIPSGQGIMTITKNKE